MLLTYIIIIAENNIINDDDLAINSLECRRVVQSMVKHEHEFSVM